ncbi:arsenic metallochaperone ArsD family protein [Arthrobacter sp. PL16]|jgi:hypothetical protein|uniref:arsenic metallochaperone ArsD family protein n=1 Tax=Arthrobacter sp. PL16 TaxID=3071720 RepID=UPI002E0D63F9
MSETAWFGIESLRKSRETDMPAIRIYEAHADTGAAGPDTDQTLMDLADNVRHLQSLGADIVRHDLAREPAAFTQGEIVRMFMQHIGSKGLPLTTVDGITVGTGTYPNRQQLLTFAGLDKATQE